MNGTPEYRKLLEIEPSATAPVYDAELRAIHAAGDQYFLPDSSRYYFVPEGRKYLPYIPNTDHGLRNTDARESSLAFYQAFLSAKPRPDLLEIEDQRRYRSGEQKANRKQ